MPIKTHINTNINLLFTFFYGQINKKDIHYFIRKLNSNDEIRSLTNTLVFLKDSKLYFNVEDVENFAKQTINCRNFAKRTKIAILVNNPNDTVAATIYAETILNFNKNVLIELFYTVEAALRFLDIEDHTRKIEKIIDYQRAIEQSDKRS